MAIQIDGDTGVSGVNGSATTPALQGTDSNTGIVFGTDEVQIATGGSTRATVDSSGNFGIGSSSPSNMLHIEGSSPSVRLKVTGGPRHMISPFSGDLYIESDPDNTSASTNTIFTVDGSEAMRLDSSGRLGLGTSSPDQKLQVEGSGSQYIAVTSTNSDNTGVLFGDSDIDSGYVLYANSDNSLRFGANAGERMRISSNGELLISRTSAAFNEKLSVQNSSNVAFFNCTTNSDVALMLFKHAYAQGSQSATQVQFRNDANSTVGSIKSTASSTSYNTSSDYRLKENVVDLDGAIARVKQLLPKRFNFIVNPETTVDGFLAHEAATVVPEAVTGTHNQVQAWDESEELPEGVSVGDNKLDEDGNTIPEYQGIDQSKLVPLLTAALQEAISKIETLETKVAALEAA